MRFTFVLSTLLTLLVSPAAQSADDTVFSLSLRSRQPAKMPWCDGHKKTTRPARWQA